MTFSQAISSVNYLKITDVSGTMMVTEIVPET
jgi:hypothetical protein